MDKNEFSNGEQYFLAPGERVEVTAEELASQRRTPQLVKELIESLYHLRIKITVIFGNFVFFGQLARLTRLTSRFLSVKQRVCYCFLSPMRHRFKLASRHVDSSVTTPQVNFHHICITCSSYRKRLNPNNGIQPILSSFQITFTGHQYFFLFLLL